MAKNVTHQIKCNQCKKTLSMIRVSDGSDHPGNRDCANPLNTACKSWASHAQKEQAEKELAERKALQAAEDKAMKPVDDKVIQGVQDLNAKELKELAKVMGLKGYSSMKKDDLVALILEAKAKKQESGEGAAGDEDQD